MALSAAVVQEGILGLEAVMEWRGFTMNALRDRAEYGNLGQTTSRVIVDRVTGLYARPDRATISEDRRGQAGERSYPAAARGKTIVYEGRIQGNDLPSLRTLTRSFRAAFNDQDDDVYEMEHSPPAQRGGVSWAYKARVLSCDLDEEQLLGPASSRQWTRGFVLSLRMMDPRFFCNPELSYTGNTNGQPGDLDVQNLGTAPTPPIFTLHGPLSQEVTLRLVGTGINLTFANQEGAMETILSGETLVVDFFEKTAYSPEHPLFDYARYVTFPSEWWDDRVPELPPGEETLRVTGCGSWDVTFRHADW